MKDHDVPIHLQYSNSHGVTHSYLLLLWKIQGLEFFSVILSYQPSHKKNEPRYGIKVIMTIGSMLLESVLCSKVFVHKMNSLLITVLLFNMNYNPIFVLFFFFQLFSAEEFTAFLKSLKNSIFRCQAVIDKLGKNASSYSLWHNKSRVTQLPST